MLPPHRHDIQKWWILLPLLAALALFTLVVGLARTTTSKPRTDSPPTRSPAQPSITPSPPPSPAPPPTPSAPSHTLALLTEGKDAAVATVAQALRSRNRGLLRPLLLDKVTLTAQRPGGGSSTLNREEAIRRLGDYWGAHPRVVDTQYVAHFALLRINTDGWARVEPLPRGNITFNLYRFDAGGTQDAFHGQWQISAIVSE